MSDKKNKPHHRDHHANPPEVSHAGWRQAHKDWRLWAAVTLMLVAIMTYVMTMDESIAPGGKPQPVVPAAPG